MRDLPREVKGALRTIVGALQHVRYAITGSLTLFLHGIDLPIGDVDIQTTAEGAYEIERCLAARASVVSPTYFRTSEHIQSHYGKLNYHGIDIELMGEVRHRISPEGWDDTPNIESIIEFVRYKDLVVPITSLLHEVRAYAEIGRPDKSAVIRHFLDSSGGRGRS